MQRGAEPLPAVDLPDVERVEEGPAGFFLPRPREESLELLDDVRGRSLVDEDPDLEGEG